MTFAIGLLIDLEFMLNKLSTITWMYHLATQTTLHHTIMIAELNRVLGTHLKSQVMNHYSWNQLHCHY